MAGATRQHTYWGAGLSEAGKAGDWANSYSAWLPPGPTMITQTVK